MKIKKKYKIYFSHLKIGKRIKFKNHRYDFLTIQSRMFNHIFLKNKDLIIKFSIFFIYMSNNRYQ